MRFSNWSRPEILHGQMTKYGWLVLYPEGLTLGEQSDIGAFTLIQAKHGVVIGRAAEIGSHCSIYSESTIDGRTGTVTVGEGAMIGTHSTLMPGVTVGKSAIVGAHSLVLHDVEPNTVVFGVPARFIRKR